MSYLIWLVAEAVTGLSTLFRLEPGDVMKVGVEPLGEFTVRVV